MTFANWIHPLLFAGGDPYADYLVYDTCTDDDATPLPNHTPEKDVIGGGYAAILGGMTIQNDTIQSPAGVAEKIIAIDCGQADVVMEAEFTRNHVNAADNRQWGFSFRVTDAANYYIARFALAGLSSFRIAERVGGAFAELGPGWVPYVWNDLATVTLRLEIIGPTFNLYANGVLQINLVDGSHLAQTAHGINFFGISLSSADNFRIAAL